MNDELWKEQAAGTEMPISRREQIFIQAARLFCTRGFAATSMSNIADAVGITKAGLYHFVENKEELLYTLMSFSMERLETDVIAPTRAIDDPLERLSAIVRLHLRLVMLVTTPVGNPLTIILEEPVGLGAEKATAIKARKAAYSRFVQETLEAIRQQGGLIDVDTRVAAFTIIGVIIRVARWHRPSDSLSVDQIIDQLTHVALRGVLTSEWLARHEYRSEMV